VTGPDVAATLIWIKVRLPILCLYKKEHSGGKPETSGEHAMKAHKSGLK
jgi:hypothetical protein